VSNNLPPFEAQLEALHSERFEVGVLAPRPDGRQEMLLREWDGPGVVSCTSWLRHENAKGAHIYVRPAGENAVTLVDDLTDKAILRMKQDGFRPAAVVETSPGNFQAWLYHEQVLPQDVSTQVARDLATRFKGDRSSATGRHFGRLAGFTNRKLKYRNDRVLYPFVRLREAKGWSYPEAEKTVARAQQTLMKLAYERAALREKFAHSSHTGNLRTIEDFRRDPQRSGDGNQIDLAWSIYALSNGASFADLEHGIRSRDLSKKGNDQRQNEYVQRTIKKAQLCLDQRGGMER
jgi:hypothetical protein